MSFNNTTELERSLLKVLTSSKFMCRQHIGSVKDDWFTNPLRRFIFKVALNTFNGSKSVLTGSVYGYEVDKCIDPSEQTNYMAEWNLVQAGTVNEPPSALMDKLREALLGRNMMDAMADVIEKTDNGDVAGALSAFKQAAVHMNAGRIDQPVVEITSYQHRLQLIRDKQQHPEKYLGIKTGFPTFDRITGGLHPQELYLLAGVTGLGKSTMVKQLAHGIITKNKNKNVLLIANEESQIQVETKFDALLTGTPYLDFKRANIKESDIEDWIETMEDALTRPGVGRIFIKEVPAFTDVSLVTQAFRELESQGIPIHAVIIDHLPHVKPLEQAWSENDDRGKAAADCKQLAKDLNVPVVTPTQAATSVEEKQTRGKEAGKLDVYGSKAQIHVSNTFIIITSKGKIEDSNLPDYEWDVRWVVDVKKNRDGPGFKFHARHHVRYGRVEEIDKDDGTVTQQIAEKFANAVQEMEEGVGEENENEIGGKPSNPPEEDVSIKKKTIRMPSNIPDSV